MKTLPRDNLYPSEALYWYFYYNLLNQGMILLRRLILGRKSKFVLEYLASSSLVNVVIDDLREASRVFRGNQDM